MDCSFSCKMARMISGGRLNAVSHTRMTYRVSLDENIGIRLKDIRSTKYTYSHNPKYDTKGGSAFTDAGAVFFIVPLQIPQFLLQLPAGHPLIFFGGVGFIFELFGALQ